MSNGKDSLRGFAAGRDENGQNLTDDPLDLARPADLKRQLDGNPSAEAETARLASGHSGQDATDETEAEIPAETVRQLGDASLGGKGGPAAEAIERATSGLGKK